MSTPNVKVGQRWTNNDPRAKGRIILIVRIYKNEWKSPETMAACRVIANPNNEQTIGNIHQIMVRRFRPVASGYTLIRDVN